MIELSDLNFLKNKYNLCTFNNVAGNLTCFYFSNDIRVPFLIFDKNNHSLTLKDKIKVFSYFPFKYNLEGFCPFFELNDECYKKIDSFITDFDEKKKKCEKISILYKIKTINCNDFEKMKKILQDVKRKIIYESKS